MPYLYILILNLSVHYTTGNMFIIVESGSTKADWVVVRNKDDIRFFKTEGVNPSTQTYFVNLENEADLLSNIRKCPNIHFYGAGVIDEMSISRIADWLISSGFKGKLFAAGDMIAAARACFGDQPGIVGILGTGSNSCIYDGYEITKTIPSLGFIFSDEGGGVHLGKEILRAYFYGMMPQKECKIFLENYNVTKELLIEKVYRSEGGSKYIASFAKFLTLVEGEWKENLIKKVFREFITLRIMSYHEHTNLKIKYVGSTAQFYARQLQEVMHEFGLNTEEIVQHPINKLIDYHLNHNINE